MQEPHLFRHIFMILVLFADPISVWEYSFELGDRSRLERPIVIGTILDYLEQPSILRSFTFEEEQVKNKFSVYEKAKKKRMERFQNSLSDSSKHLIISAVVVIAFLVLLVSVLRLWQLHQKRKAQPLLALQEDLIGTTPEEKNVDIEATVDIDIAKETDHDKDAH
mmetsp:Transcript_18693/g.24674  ORF Transcript_18693/g.24674 Transcript_18693/m.24674 type:complete len:165 (-) Transcript_18693:87-581(-)